MTELKKQLIQKYEIEQKSSRQVAKELNMNQMAVLDWLRLFKIKVRSNLNRRGVPHRTKGFVNYTELNYQ